MYICIFLYVYIDVYTLNRIRQLGLQAGTAMTTATRYCIGIFDAYEALHEVVATAMIINGNVALVAAQQNASKDRGCNHRDKQFELIQLINS